MEFAKNSDTFETLLQANSNFRRGFCISLINKEDFRRYDFRFQPVKPTEKTPMKTFDPKEKKGRFSGESHSEKPGPQKLPRRDDSGSRNDYDSPSEFMKDQRKERRPRLGNTPREENETPRRSSTPTSHATTAAKTTVRLVTTTVSAGTTIVRDEMTTAVPANRSVKTTSLTAVMGMKSGPTAITAAKSTAAGTVPITKIPATESILSVKTLTARTTPRAETAATPVTGNARSAKTTAGAPTATAAADMATVGKAANAHTGITKASRNTTPRTIRASKHPSNPEPSVSTALSQTRASARVARPTT